MKVLPTDAGCCDRFVAGTMEGYLLKNSGGKKNVAFGARRSSLGNALSRWERR